MLILALVGVEPDVKTGWLFPITIFVVMMVLLCVLSREGMHSPGRSRRQQ
jgi:hypothetical protein